MANTKEAYDEMLGKLEQWTETLATRGPKAVEEVQDTMHQYLELKFGEDFEAFKKEYEEENQ